MMADPLLAQSAMDRLQSSIGASLPVLAWLQDPVGNL